MFKHRALSGCVMGVSVVIAVNLLPPAGALLVILSLAVIAQLEFYGMLKRVGVGTFRTIGVLSGAALIIGTLYTIGPDSSDALLAFRLEQAVLFAGIVAVFVAQAVSKDKTQSLLTIACTVFGIMYIPYLLNFFTRLCYGWEHACPGTPVSDTGRLLVVYAVLVVKITDTFAYLVGSQIGKHKVFPVMSPGKTLEGLVGGVTMAVVTSVIFQIVCKGQVGQLSMSIYDAVILGFLLAITGIAGDLFESIIKRSTKSKDSGSVIPGMGGFLDVLDSLLFGVPVVYFYAQVFLK